MFGFRPVFRFNLWCARHLGWWHHEGMLVNGVYRSPRKCPWYYPRARILYMENCRWHLTGNMPLGSAVIHARRKGRHVVPPDSVLYEGFYDGF